MFRLIAAVGSVCVARVVEGNSSVDSNAKQLQGQDKPDKIREQKEFPYVVN